MTSPQSDNAAVAPTADPPLKPHTSPLWRGLVLGIALVPVTCFIVMWAELVLMTLQIGYLQMPPAVIGILLFLLAINAPLKKWGTRIALSPQELMVAYSMMVMAAMISSRGLMQKLVPLLVAVNYFATDGNNKWGFEDYDKYLSAGNALPVGWQGVTFLLIGMVVTA